MEPWPYVLTWPVSTDTVSARDSQTTQRQRRHATHALFWATFGEPSPPPLSERMIVQLTFEHNWAGLRFLLLGYFEGLHTPGYTGLRYAIVCDPHPPAEERALWNNPYLEIACNKRDGEQLILEPTHPYMKTNQHQAAWYALVAHVTGLTLAKTQPFLTRLGHDINSYLGLLGS